MNVLVDSYESYPAYRMIRNYNLYSSLHITDSKKLAQKMAVAASNIGKVAVKANLDTKMADRGMMIADKINFNEDKPEDELPVQKVSLAESEMTGSGKKKGRKPSSHKSGTGKSRKTRSFLDSLLS